MEKTDLYIISHLNSYKIIILLAQVLNIFASIWEKEKSIITQKKKKKKEKRIWSDDYLTS